MVRLLAYPFLLLTSTAFVEAMLRRAGQDTGSMDEGKRDTGTAIGKLENVLVLTLFFADAFTALALVFGAKSIVRIEDTDSSDSTYYLAGTLANFTWSLLVAAAFDWIAIFYST